MSAAPLRRRRLAVAGTAAALALVAAGCTSNTPEDRGHRDAAAPAAAASGNDEPGDKVIIGFSGPRRRPRLDGLRSPSRPSPRPRSTPTSSWSQAEGTNDVNLQISQIEPFINDKVDAIVLLPFDGAALTEVATKAMDAGIPVINVDREFDDPYAARTTVLGDNYGMGVSAGAYICERARRQDRRHGRRDRRHRLAAADPGPQPGLRGRARRRAGSRSSNRVAADFTVQGGEAAASNLLQAAPKIDAIWNHDDDQGVGVLAAIDNAGRDEFFMVGGAGSKNVMDAIKADNTVLKATVIYPSDAGRRRHQARPADRPGQGR